MELPFGNLETHILKCGHSRTNRSSRCRGACKTGSWLAQCVFLRIKYFVYTHSNATLAACTTGIVFNISGGKDLTLQEVNTVSEVVTSLADKDCNIIFGAMVDDKYEGGELQVTIIATGFSQNYEAELLAAPATNTRKPLVVPVTKVSLGPGSWG